MAKKLVYLPQSAKRILLSSLGGTIELYDFVIFALFSPMIANAFFPMESELARLLGVYAVFAIGYLARPFGGILFSHYGDKYGRKNVFSLTIAIMGIATLLMSIIPSFQAAGLFATCVFILLRLIQGLAISGEIPGALTYISEHTRSRPGFACGLIIAFLNLGILLANGVYSLLTLLLDESFFLTDGWRIAFALGGFAALISLLYRRHLDETPVFAELEARPAVPIMLLLKEHSVNVIASILITGLAATLVSVYLLFLPSYLQSVLGMKPQFVGKLSLLQLLLLTILSPLYSYLSDFIDRQKLLTISSMFIAVASVLFFRNINSGSSCVAFIVLNVVVIASFLGGYAAFLTELFPTEVRYSGMALSYNLGFAIFGGLSPFFSTLLIHQLKWQAAPMTIVIGACFLALTGLIMLKGNRNVRLQMTSS